MVTAYERYLKDKLKICEYNKMTDDNRYANGKIYRLVNSVDGEFYVGSTCTSLAKRFYRHKQTAKQNINQRVYAYFNNIVWEHVSIVLVEEYTCKNIMELLQRERHWIEELNPSLNKNIPTRTTQEWRVENADKMREWAVQYRAKNADKMRERDAKYYANNADKVRERGVKYRANNVDVLHERRAKYYAENADHVREKVAKYQAENADKVRERQAKYYADNADKVRKRKAKYYAENVDKERERKLKYREANRDEINAKRRERYALKKQQSQS
jgi:hypothetical protein